MSRYQIEALPFLKAQHPHREVYVGWDNPLQTFFGQVLDSSRPAGEPEAVFWIGTAPQECTDLIAFARAMRPWAPIPMRILAALARDHCQAVPPTPLQQALFPMVIEETEEDADMQGPGPDSDPQVFLDYWHQGKAEEHWSSPHGCHEQCPACKEESLSGGAA
jgi:hypothetical protein